MKQCEQQSFVLLASDEETALEDHIKSYYNNQCGNVIKAFANIIAADLGMKLNIAKFT